MKTRLAIIVFKDYGIATVKEGKSSQEHSKIIEILKNHPEFAAIYEMEIDETLPDKP